MCFCRERDRQVREKRNFLSHYDHREQQKLSQFGEEEEIQEQRNSRESNPARGEDPCYVETSLR